MSHLVLFLFLLAVALAKAEPSLAQFCNDDPLQGVETAIGCLRADNPNFMIGQILGWGVIVGAGIAFLLIAFAGFQITTAAGDPKRVQAARELLTSAISGLLLIIFSIFLLNLIGLNILNLNPFGLPMGNP